MASIGFDPALDDERPEDRSHMIIPKLKLKTRPWRSVLGASLLSVVGLVGLNRATGQSLFFEDFEGVVLGANREEGRAGTSVWSATGPAGWVEDDSRMPGIGNAATDGVVEWAGWSFANKDWWVAAAGGQRRAEFVNSTGTAMIADPDEWDDAAHTQGLFNAFISTPAIDLTGVAANSLVLTFDSSWRPEGFDDGLPNFPVDAEGNRINNQTAKIRTTYGTGGTNVVLHWDSKSDGEFFKADGEFINESVVLPLGNAAGAGPLKLTISMEEAANDWWWAVDNITVGVPPLVTGLAANGVGFTVRIAEALGKSVNQAAGVTVELDGATVSPVTVTTPDADRLSVAYSRSPAIFAPGSRHTVKVKFTANDGRQVTETRNFVAPSYTAVAATPTRVTATISDAAWLTVDESKGVQLKLDGVAVTAGSVSRAAESTQVVVRYTAATPFAANSAHTLEVTFTTAAGVQVVDTVTFTAPDYKTLPATLATAPGTGTQPGLRWRTHQLATGRGTTIALAEQQLAGTLGATIHDTSGETGGFFLVDYVNFDQAAGAAGNFSETATIPNQMVPDLGLPGIPGTEGGNDNVAAEALTFVEIPAAGLYTMVVNSDDGFQVSAGTATSPKAIVLGQFDAGRGSSDTEFYFRAEQPGVYFFRLLYFEGGGGANVEWFTVNNDGSRALLNGAQTGALKTFRARSVAEPGVGGGSIQGISLTAGKVVITFTGTLKSAATVNGVFTPVAGAVSPFEVTPEAAQQFYRAE